VIDEIVFDALPITKDLRAGGFTEQQAETLVKANRDILTAVLGTTLATKSDILNLGRKFEGLERKFEGLENAVGLFASGVKSDYRVLKWLMSTLIAIAITVALKMLFPGLHL
jgi:hypothetical protein